MNPRQIRAAFGTADLASGGILTTEQLAAFYVKAFAKQRLLPLVRTEFCSAQQKELPILDFGTRKIAKATEGAIITPTHKPTPSKVSISLQKAALPWTITAEAMKWNVTRGQLENTMFMGMAGLWGRDLEDLAVNGDTTSGTPFLAFDNGWLKTCSTGCNDFNGATVNGGVLVEEHLTSMLAAMPEQYLDMTPGTSLRWILSARNMVKWSQAVTERGDQAGTLALLGDSRVYAPYNIPMITPVAWPNDIILLCDPRMLVLAVDGEMEYQMDGSGYTLMMSDSTAYIIRQYLDFAVVDKTAIVRCYGMV